ncbi:hypothetical protein EV363DRAFT_1473134 [Boletus edulis]|nr:hypothetical protein EV363DRAFT_1473134 [Boletus edulis]
MSNRGNDVERARSRREPHCHLEGNIDTMTAKRNVSLTVTVTGVSMSACDMTSGVRVSSGSTNVLISARRGRWRGPYLDEGLASRTGVTIDSGGVIGCMQGAKEWRSYRHDHPWGMGKGEKRSKLLGAIATPWTVSNTTTGRYVGPANVSIPEQWCMGVELTYSECLTFSGCQHDGRKMQGERNGVPSRCAQRSLFLVFSEEKHTWGREPQVGCHLPYDGRLIGGDSGAHSKRPIKRYLPTEHQHINASIIRQVACMLIYLDGMVLVL